MTTLGLIINPTSGAGRGAQLGREFVAGLAGLGVDYVDLSGDSAESAMAQGRAAIAAGKIDGLVVLGGDGMVHLGVNLLVGTGLPLMVVGAGTGNDSARLLGMPIHDVQASLAYLAKHLKDRKNVDAAKVESGGKSEYLFGSVSAGFDAIVNARANKLRWPKGKARYPLALFAELPKFAPLEYEVEIDGVRRSFSAMLVAVANAPAYGGGMQIAPAATVTDGVLDLFIVHKISRFELVRLFPKVYSGGHVGHPAVEFVSAKQVTLSAKGVPAYADGEYVGQTPLKVTVLPGALTVFG